MSSSAFSIIIIDKHGNARQAECKRSDFRIDELYKKCGFKTPDGFKQQAQWKQDGGIVLSLWGRDNGKAGQENKFEFPPPVDEALFFGSCVVIATNGKGNYVTFTLNQWTNAYNALYGGFEDIIDEEDEEDEEEEEDEDLEDDDIIDDSDIDDDVAAQGDDDDDDEDVVDDDDSNDGETGVDVGNENGAISEEDEVDQDDDDAEDVDDDDVDDGDDDCGEGDEEDEEDGSSNRGGNGCVSRRILKKTTATKRNNGKRGNANTPMSSTTVNSGGVNKKQRSVSNNKRVVATAQPPTKVFEELIAEEYDYDE